MHCLLQQSAVDRRLHLNGLTRFDHVPSGKRLALFVEQRSNEKRLHVAEAHLVKLPIAPAGIAVRIPCSPV